MPRVHNFSAGPAALPTEVLEQIRDDIPDWNNSGMSVMEVSHRSKDFVELADRAESSVRKLLAITDDYSVMFLQGGASLQFAMAALNLSAPGDTADYVLTGAWGKNPFIEGVQSGNLQEIYTRLGGTGSPPIRYQSLYTIILHDDMQPTLIMSTYGGISSLD